MGFSSAAGNISPPPNGGPKKSKEGFSDHQIKRSREKRGVLSFGSTPRLLPIHPGWRDKDRWGRRWPCGGRLCPSHHWIESGDNNCWMGAPSVLKVLVMAGNDPLSVQRFNSLLKKSFESWKMTEFLSNCRTRRTELNYNDDNEFRQQPKFFDGQRKRKAALFSTQNCSQQHWRHCGVQVLLHCCYRLPHFQWHRLQWCHCKRGNLYVPRFI